MSGPYDVPDDPDDVTLWAGRLRSWPARPTEPGDRDAGDDVDDDTAVSSREVTGDETRRVARRESVASMTTPPEEPVADTIRVEPRGSATPGPELPDEADHTVPRAPQRDERDDLAADTAAGGRRARVRPSGPAAGGEPEGAVREARVPAVSDREIYGPRPDTVVRVARRVPTARPSVVPDAAEVRPRSARGRRTRLVVTVAAVALLVLGAAAALMLLMG